MVYEQLADRINAAFSDLPLNAPFATIGVGHTEYPSVARFLATDWDSPDGRAFEVASEALPFLTKKSFTFVLAKYLFATVVCPKLVLGNEFSSQLPLLLSNKEYSQPFWEALIELNSRQKAVLLEWTDALKDSNFSTYNYGFGNMLKQITARIV